MISPKEVVNNAENEEKQTTIFKVGQIIPGFTKKKIDYYIFLVHLIKIRNGSGPFRVCAVKPASRLVNGNRQQIQIEHLVDGQWQQVSHNAYCDSSIIDNHWIPGWIFIEPTNKY